MTDTSTLNMRAGSKFDTNNIKSYENTGMAIGQAMAAVSQIRQVSFQKPEILNQANKADLDLQNLRTSQFATFGACGAAVGATIDATEEAKAAGIPGAKTKVVCGSA